MSGRAAQYGRLVLHRRLPAMDSQPDRRQAPHDALRRTSRVSLDRGRADVEAPGAAQAVP